MKENDSKPNKAIWTAGMSDVVLSCVIPYIEDPKDRDAVSLVCHRWYELDALTRKHITITASCTTTLDPLRRRFGHLESLKFKGKPSTTMFPWILEDYMPPWVREIAVNFNYLKSLHFARMTVRDPALELLARSRGNVLHVLKIDKCIGPSSDGLLHVGRFCRQLRTLLLEDSMIVEKDGQWLHELAMNNTVLESLNFYMTDLGKVSVKDLELLAKNCSSLVAVKVSDFEVSELVDFFRAATALKEFSGASFKAERENYSDIQFPPRLCSVGLLYMGKNEMPILFPFATSLRKLDLLFTFLDTEDLCVLIQRCPNLEILEARNVIGDRGLQVLAQSCKRLKRLKIERGADDQGLEDEEGVSEEGLITLAQGCLELEYLSIYISDITNAALECIGTYLNNLSDFRLVLLDREERITDLSLDNGVRALLMGCKKLRRIALYLRPGCLTDLDLCFIDHYRPNIRWKHLNV